MQLPLTEYGLGSTDTLTLDALRSIHDGVLCERGKKFRFIFA